MKRLKSYITEAFYEVELDIKLYVAGQAHYRKASNDDWAAVKRLLFDCNSLITENAAALTVGSNIPVAFATTFNKLKTEFDTLNKGFFNARLNSEIDMQSKIEAINDIFRKVSDVYADGQLLFKNNEAVKKLYTFDLVLLTETGPDFAGIKETAKDSVTGLPLPAGVFATISNFVTEYSTTTDENS